MPQPQRADGNPFSTGQSVTWILVANRSSARIYRMEALGKGFDLIEEMVHPEGRLQDREMGSDRAGRTFSSGSKNMRHGLDPQESQHDHESEKFAKSLIQKVETARGQQKFDQLILASEPRFLGMMKSNLSRQSENMLSLTIDREFTDYEFQDEKNVTKLLETAIKANR